jgi:AcrR family transcriptional regulator
MKAETLSPKTAPKRRHRSYQESHQAMLETAVRLISEKGVDALSIAELARAMGIDRTTVYYHFESREDLIAEVKAWSSAQLAKAFQADASQQDQIDFTTRYVLENPELMKLWLTDVLSGFDIRQSFPYWDDLVATVRAQAAEAGITDIDVEVYCATLLTSVMLGPCVLKKSICPGVDDETVVQRFRKERQRSLKQLHLLQD